MNDVTQIWNPATDPDCTCLIIMVDDKSIEIPGDPPFSEVVDRLVEIAKVSHPRVVTADIYTMLCDGGIVADTFLQLRCKYQE